MIPQGAKHPENAHRFIDFLLKPEIAAQTAQAQPFRSPVPAASEFLSQAFLDDPAINIPSQLLENAEFIMDLGDYETKYQNIWTDFKLLNQ